MIGHNGYSFDDVVQENLECGLYWAQRDCLIRAVRDPDLSHRHRIVIAEIIAMTNAQSGVAYPGRKHLAEVTGYTEAGIAKTISELVDMGYVVSTRRVPEQGRRPLAHYSIIKPTSDELRAAIDAHIEAIRSVNVTPTGNAKWAGNVTPGRNVTSNSNVTPVGNVSDTTNEIIEQNQRPTNNVTPVGNVTPVVPTVTSSVLNLEDRPVSNRESGRATRLREDWVLPLSWGQWAAEHFAISRDEILGEAAAFKDHWTGSGNTRNASKKNWQSAWRNWVRGSRKRYRLIKPETGVAPDLGSVGRAVSAGDAESIRLMDAIVSGGR